MSQLKKSKKLPVHIVEQHNDVLPFIHRAIASRKLPFTDIPMLHFDSHPDLLLPTNLVADVVFDPPELYGCLSIENWILPLTYAKHLNHVIWVKPPWARQIESSEQTFSIGKCEVSGFVRLSSKENYFLTDALYQPAEKLCNRTEVKLSVVKLVPKAWPELDKSYSPSPSCKTDTMSSINEWLPHLQDQLTDKQYILDVDLDFFSTANPFRGMVEPEIEAALASLYKCTMPSKDSDDDKFLSFTHQRLKQLEALEKIFTILESKWSDVESIPSSEELQEMTLEDLGLDEINISCCHGNVEEKIKTLVQAVLLNNQSRDLTFRLLHDFGCTLDDTELPHHISTTQQMDALFDEFTSMIEKLPKPSIVTISRSSDDEYCPKDQVDLLQKNVLTLLEKLYGSLNISYDYS